MSNIKLFESKNIRSVWNELEQKWYFVVEDVIAILTDSNDPKQYVKRMRQRDLELAKGSVQLVPTVMVVVYTIRVGTMCTPPVAGSKSGVRIGVT